MEQQFQAKPQKEEQRIDIKNSLFKVLGYWPFVMGSAIIGLAFAFTINRYTQNTFELSTLLAIEEKNNPLSSADNSRDNSIISLDLPYSEIADVRI